MPWFSEELVLGWPAIARAGGKTSLVWDVAYEGTSQVWVRLHWQKVHE